MNHHPHPHHTLLIGPTSVSLQPLDFAAAQLTAAQANPHDPAAPVPREDATGGRRCSWLPMPFARFRSVVVTTLLALTLAIVPACSVNPATGRMQFNVLTDEQHEISLGEQAAPEFLADFGGELPDEGVVEYVRAIGHELAEVSERPGLPWEFHVVDSATVNAFALPGGKIFISRGLLELMDNEAQLAGVLGHEIGHVTAQHIGQQMARQLGVNIGLMAIGMAARQSDEDWLTALGVGAHLGGSLYLLSFSRTQENESDELGIRYMAKAGYNPLGQLQVMEILHRQSQQHGAGIEWLSTHPLPQTRIERVESIIQDQYPEYEDPQRYIFGQERFRSVVSEALEQLPPPAHNPAAQREETASAVGGS